MMGDEVWWGIMVGEVTGGGSGEVTGKHLTI